MESKRQNRIQPPSKFLTLLYEVLDDVNIESMKWIQNGFIIENMNLFKTELMPQYFKHKKYTSFLRQLNKYGFSVKEKEKEYTIFTHPYISEERRQFKKSRENQQQEQSINFKNEMQQIQQEIIQLQINQNQLKQQIELSNKVMKLFVKNFIHFQKQTLETISYGGALSSLITNNLQKVSPNISGDIRVHQLAAAKIAFPEYFESALITPNQSLLNTPLPFYIAILKELVEIADNVTKQ